MKRTRYQGGNLRREPRKGGHDVWVLRWRETDLDGKRRERKQILGTVQQLTTKAEAQIAAQTLRLDINNRSCKYLERPRTLRMLVDHYRQKELPMISNERKTHLTQQVYQQNLKLHILPRWGDYALRQVSSVEVEEWLRSLKYANGTKAKLRNLMSAIFRHAIRYGWLGLNENPTAMVRVSAKRKRIPAILTAEEFRALLARLPAQERMMGILCATTGLRISEVLGLKWEDIDFAEGLANVTRSVSAGYVERCKTETSQQPVPLAELTLEELLRWRQIAPYGAEEDWLFGSARLFGQMPVWAGSARSKVLQPVARKAGITKTVGWHTFRHTYSSLLAENGNDVKVVQELMRHAKVTTTMEIYTHARMERKRVAQSGVVDVLFERVRTDGEAARA